MTELTECKACDHPISTMASACPYCGHPGTNLTYGDSITYYALFIAVTALLIPESLYQYRALIGAVIIVMLIATLLVGRWRVTRKRKAPL